MTVFQCEGEASNNDAAAAEFEQSKPLCLRTCEGEASDAEMEMRPDDDVMGTKELKEAMLEVVHEAKAAKEAFRKYRETRMAGKVKSGTEAEDDFGPEAGFKRVITPGSQGSSNQGILMSESPVRVRFQMGVSRVFGVNTQAQTFNVQVKLKMMWKPPTTEVMPGKAAWNWVPSWAPQYRFRRLMDEASSTESFSVTHENGIPYVKANYEHIVTIYETMELNSFPVDMQKLGLDIISLHSVQEVIWVPFQDHGSTRVDNQESQESRGSHGASVVLENNGSRGATLQRQSTFVGLSETVYLDVGILALGDFQLVKEAPYIYRLSTVTLDDRTASLVSVEVNLARKCFYYMWNVLAIMAGIISYVFCTWSTHPGDIDDRQDTDFDLILTAVAFKLVLTELLPVVSYVTLADIYVNGGCLFLCAVTVAHSILPHTVAKLTDMSPLTLPPLEFVNEDVLIHRDDILMKVSAGIWISFNVIYFSFLFIHQYRSYWRSVEKSLARQREYRHEMNTR